MMKTMMAKSACIVAFIAACGLTALVVHAGEQQQFAQERAQWSTDRACPMTKVVADKLDGKRIWWGTQPNGLDCWTIQHIH